MDQKTFTFITKCGNFEFTIKNEFLEKCPDPASTDTGTLLKDFQMRTFMHNTKGPALVYLLNNYKEYWVNGRIISNSQTIDGMKLEKEGVVE